MKLLGRGQSPLEAELSPLLPTGMQRLPEGLTRDDQEAMRQIARGSATLFTSLFGIARDTLLVSNQKVSEHTIFSEFAGVCRLVLETETEIQQLRKKDIESWTSTITTPNRFSHLAANEDVSDLVDKLRKALLVTRQFNTTNFLVAKLVCYRFLAGRNLSGDTEAKKRLKAATAELQDQQNNTQHKLHLEHAKGWHDAMFQREPVEGGINISPSTAGITFKAPFRTQLEKDIEALGLMYLKNDLQAATARSTHPGPSIDTKLLKERELLITSNDLVLAHYHGKNVVEIFQLSRTENGRAGWAKKIATVNKVEKFADGYFKSARRVKYRIRESRLTVDAEKGFRNVRRDSRPARYKKAAVVNGEAEKHITKALREVGTVGGWWEAALRGIPPTGEIGKKGFRSMQLADVIAGLSRWFTHSQHLKAVSWAVFPSATLNNTGEKLIVANGHLDSFSPNGCKDSEDRIDLWANEESPLWERQMMVG